MLTVKRVLAGIPLTFTKHQESLPLPQRIQSQECWGSHLLPINKKKKQLRLVKIKPYDNEPLTRCGLLSSSYLQKNDH